MAAERAVPAGWAVLAVVSVTTVLIPLDGTMASIALPAVVDDVGASTTEATWRLLLGLWAGSAPLRNRPRPLRSVEAPPAALAPPEHA